MKETYKLYFASPFFNPEQVEREERMKKHLRDLGFEVFSPKENTFLPPNASVEDQKSTFADNLRGIDEADAVFAITDGKDMGTIWEAGYAYGKNVPIIYFAETLGNGQFNLMLARSARLVYQSQNDVNREEIIQAIEDGMSKDYEGQIE